MLSDVEVGLFSGIKDSGPKQIPGTEAMSVKKGDDVVSSMIPYET